MVGGRLLRGIISGVARGGGMMGNRIVVLIHIGRGLVDIRMGKGGGMERGMVNVPHDVMRVIDGIATEKTKVEIVPTRGQEGTMKARKVVEMAELQPYLSVTAMIDQGNILFETIENGHT